MPKPIPNLVLELGETNLPQDPCRLPCIDKHFIVVKPKDYNKRKKTLKIGAITIQFTVKAKVWKQFGPAIIEDAKNYRFKNG